MGSRHRNHVCEECREAVGTRCGLSGDLVCENCAKAMLLRNVGENDQNVAANVAAHVAVAQQVYQQENSEAEKDVCPEDIHINEVITYLINKLDVIPHDMLLKITCDFYNEQEVENAKMVAFNTCGFATNERMKRRQGPNRHASNVGDLIELLHKVPPRRMPKFVALNINRLPPIDTNHIDISVLLVEMRNMRTQLTDLLSLKQEIEEIKKSNEITEDIRLMRNEITSIKGLYQSTPSNVVEKPSINNTQGDSSNNHNNDSKTFAEVVKHSTNDENDDVTRVKTLLQNRNSSGHQPNITISNNTNEGRNPNINDGENLNTNDGRVSNPINEFTTVSRKKKPRSTKPIIGSAKNSGNLTIVHKNRHTARIFISRLSPNTEPETIIDHVKSKFDITDDMIKCNKLETKYNTYASFLIECFVKDPTLLLTSENWPEGTLVRKYYTQSTQKIKVNA